VCALLATARAQNEEADFNQKQAKALNAYAKKVFEKGFPRQARIVWLQVHKLYDPDNAEAWTALGYAKVGSSWNPDPKHPYPTTDTGAGADGQALQRQYEALRKELANQHRYQAEKWAKAGNKARALAEARAMVDRMMPIIREQPEAAEALLPALRYRLERGITVSMSRKGDCWDNAPMESANGTVKVECVHGEHFRTRAEAQRALVEYIGYYNTERRHSSLGNLSPAAFEQRWHSTRPRQPLE